MYIALSAGTEGTVVVSSLDARAESIDAPSTVALEALPAEVARREVDHPRWVWSDTGSWYPPLLRAGVRVERCVDLRLSHAILRNSELTSSSLLATAQQGSWDHSVSDRIGLGPGGIGRGVTLFDLDEAALPAQEDSVEEFRIQRLAIDSAQDPARIGLLLAAESAGALVAAEIGFAGVPWRADLHNELLTRHLGPRPQLGERPLHLAELLERIRTALGAPECNPDSPSELLKSLANAGIMAASTRSWELKKIDHPAIPPLLEYKKLSRLLNANGWHWLDTNVQNGRFYPDYVPGGVVTGRWASKGGGGALQLPKNIRSVVVADPGWKFVVADASQLEPRILAALSGDRAMAEAGRSKDMYAAIVASGAVSTRDQAKVAMLGAMYGATTGESGRLMPKLTRAYPRAIELVEEAARAGERGEIVTTRLGRSSPQPSAQWRAAQEDARSEGATEIERKRARSEARTWGRFTRNFVVQGSAAEWALCWMATLRGSLHEFSGRRWLTNTAHLVFFMHDELVIHCPADAATEVEKLVRDAAVQAGKLLFGATLVEFPLTVAIVDNYGEAK